MAGRVRAFTVHVGTPLDGVVNVVGALNRGWHADERHGVRRRGHELGQDGAADAFGWYLFVTSNLNRSGQDRPSWMAQMAFAPELLPAVAF